MPPNFLILDEPTNHLDMTSQEVLPRAPNDYTKLPPVEGLENEMAFRVRLKDLENKLDVRLNSDAR